MNQCWQILCAWIFVISTCSSRLFTTNNMPDWKLVSTKESAGEPLLLTPLIENGLIAKARQLSRVDSSLFLNITSYSGYLNVNKKSNSNLWFWFFPAEGTGHLDDPDNEDYDDYSDSFKTKSDELKDERPLILWLQGGPGSSSLFGLFTEIGPFSIKDDDELALILNEHSWHKKYSLLFIDNPVGTGFSFTDDDGLTRNSTKVGEHLYDGLVQFLNLFPWLQREPFFITGESYAGKYIPSIGYQIYKNNQDNWTFKINLQGLALGNAISDPINMLDYSDYAYQLGLVDDEGKREMKLFEILARQHIYKLGVSKNYWDIIMGIFITRSSYKNLYNMLMPNAIAFEPYLNFMNQAHIRKAIHVGNQDHAPPQRVYSSMIEDFMVSAMPYTEYLLEKGCRIMYYSGNLDFIVAYPLSENAYLNMKWSKLETYKMSERKPFFVNDTLAGYIRKADNFADVLILNAGHMVPTDKPEAALYILDRFINNEL